MILLIIVEKILITKQMIYKLLFFYIKNNVKKYRSMNNFLIKLFINVATKCFLCQINNFFIKIKLSFITGR